MASKKRSHAASTSSTQPQFDRTRFPTLSKARLFEDQFKNRTVETEREIAEELQQKAIFRSIVNRNWYSLVKFETKVVYTDWVREFYCNLEFDDSTNSLKTFVRGKAITISVGDVADFLDIPCVQQCDYPIPEDSQGPIDYDRIGTILCGEETLWPSGLLPHGSLTEEYRFLNRFVCHNVEPRGHTSDINHKNGYLLYCIGTGKTVNIPQVIFNALLKMLSAKKNSILPFAVFITEFLIWKQVPRRNNEPSQKLRNPINSRTLAQSSAHIPGAVQGAGVHEEAVAPEAQVQGEPQQNLDRIALLTEQMQAMNANMNARFATIDGRLDVFDMRFNSVDEGIARILARIQPQ